MVPSRSAPALRAYVPLTGDGDDVPPFTLTTWLLDGRADDGSCHYGYPRRNGDPEAQRPSRQECDRERAGTDGRNCGRGEERGTPAFYSIRRSPERQRALRLDVLADHRRHCLAGAPRRHK